MLDASIFSKYKTKQDFDREREEFEFRKRQRALREQLMTKQLNQTESLGMEQLLAKSIQAGGVQNLSPQEQAQLQAFDIAQRTKQSVDPYGRVISNRSVFDMLPGQVRNMPPRDIMSAPIQQTQSAPPPQYSGAPAPMGSSGYNPVEANRAATAAQAQKYGLTDRPNAADTQGQMQPDTFVEPQPQERVTVSPSDTSGLLPNPQQDLYLRAGEANIDLQKQRLLEQQKAELKAAEEQAKLEKQRAAQAQANRIYQEVGVQDIDAALRILQDTPSAAGTLAAGGALIKESPAGRLNSLLKPISGGVGFERLNKMRQSSPTGASGLGSLSKPEMDLLLASLGELQVTTDPNLLSRNLMRYRNTLMDTIHGTPEHIRGLVAAGEISQDLGARLAQRYDLSGMNTPLSAGEKKELMMLREKYGR